MGMMTTASAPGDLAGRTVLFLLTEDWYFWLHWQPLARAARDAGAHVVIAARMAEHHERIRAAGFEPCHISFDRSGLNPWRDLQTFRAILSAYRKFRPHIVHHIALKPLLYGSAAAWIRHVPAVVNTMAGMGFLFVSRSATARILRTVVEGAMRVLNNRGNTRLVLQNDDDRVLFEKTIAVRSSQIAVIRGTGVDVEEFRPSPEPAEPAIAVFVGRMLWDKGIGELVEAARLLKARGASLKVRLVGPTDANPASIPQSTLEAWQAEGVVDVAGPSTDIAGEYARAHIAVLPSYREGLPRALLEAAACGRPMVATDVPGCREICRDHVTGLLVPARAVEPLADALEQLAGDAALRQRLGRTAREVVVREFAESVVQRETLALYRALLDER
jgi:glycosyltransferase involved in cell wall biosynthesis